MSRELVLYIAMSLDGYIAKKDGGVDWLKGLEETSDGDPNFSTFYDSIDTVLMGRKTYEQIVHDLSPDKWVYKGKDALVVSRGDHEDDEDVRFVGEDYPKMIRALKEQEGKDVWLIGGSELILSAQKEHLIDRFIVTIIPSLLGQGIPLFKEIDKETLLRPCKMIEFDGMVQITYEKRGEK